MTLSMNLRKMTGLITLAGGLAAMSLTACSSAPKSSAGAVMSDDKPSRGDLLIRAADGANSEGDIVGALQLLNDAEKEVPKSAALHFVRATSFYYRKDFSLAETSLKRSLQLDPKYSPAHNMLGKIYLDQGKRELAEKHLRLAAEDLLFRDGYKAWTNLGVLFYRAGDDEKARDSLNRAIMLGGFDACVARYFVGHIEMKSSRFKEAIQQYADSTRRQCGTFVEGHMALATAYERSRQFELARKKYLEIRDLFPNSPYAEQAFLSLSKLP